MLYGSWMLAGIIDSPQGAKEFMKLDPAPELFKGPEEELFAFVKGHIQKYGATPTRGTVQKHVPDISLPTDVPEPPAYYYDRMRQRFKHMTMKETLLAAGDLLNTDQPDDAEQVVFDTLLRLRRAEYRRRVIDYAQDGHDIIHEHLVAMKKGLGEGIPFGWPTVDEASLGMQGGDLISFIGRPGKGKTYMMLYLLLHGWSKGFSPMFVSMEMNPKLIVHRMAAIDTSTSATQIKTAHISNVKQKHMMTQLIENKNRPPAWVIDGGLSATPEDVLLHALEKKPDVVYIDGAYLLRTSFEGRKGMSKRWERMSDNAEAIKRDIAEGLNIPVVCSYQFNRDAAKVQKKNATSGGLEGIAGADAVGQLSSLVFGMFEEDSAGNVETMKRRKIEILKGRHGELGEFSTNWVFDKPPFMDFSEIETETLASLSNL